MPLFRRFPTVCRAPLTSAASTTTATALSTRPLSSFINRLSDSVTAKVTQLTEEVWLADEKLVTEPRRAIEPQRALSQSLAERLAAQRSVRQRLVPTSIKVDKSRQYVTFTWPAEAAEVMRRIAADAEAAASAAAEAANKPTSSKTEARSSDSPVLSVNTPETERSESTKAASPASSSPSSSSAAHQTRERQMPLRTRALAEYLRAYTPSTDGALGARDIVIYGRRGITISQIIPIGNYALRFVFSDDHAGGIYSYEYLFYLTGPETKYGLMRAYIQDLKQRRKSRDPPKRAPSRRYAKQAKPGDKTTQT